MALGPARTPALVILIVKKNTEGATRKKVTVPMDRSWSTGKSNSIRKPFGRPSLSTKEKDGGWSKTVTQTAGSHECSTDGKEKASDAFRDQRGPRVQGKHGT